MCVFGRNVPVCPCVTACGCACVCVYTDANKGSTVAAGGVEAIVQGMKAHVGVAAVQEHGAWALWNLAINGAVSLSDVVPMRMRRVLCVCVCVVGGVWMRGSCYDRCLTTRACARACVRACVCVCVFVCVCVCA